MKSVLLTIAARVVVPLQLVMSVLLLVRGHDEPGGGFAGGLMAASSVIMMGLAHGMEAARRFLRVAPPTLIGLGLLAAGFSGIWSLFDGRSFLTGIWSGISIPTWVAGELKIGTPLLFDVGVYLVVTGVSCLMIFSLWRQN